MLVHIEHEHWTTGGERGPVIGRRAVHQSLVPWAIGQDLRAGAAGLRLAHGDELGLPAIHSSKASGHGESGARFVRLARRIKIESMQNGIGRDQHLAFRSVDQESWRLVVIQRGGPP